MPKRSWSFVRQPRALAHRDALPARAGAPPTFDPRAVSPSVSPTTALIVPSQGEHVSSWQRVANGSQSVASKTSVWLTSKRWEWRVALVALVFTLLLHPPVLGENAGGNWDYIEMQARHPLDPPSAPVTSHGAKLAFRLVPVLLVRLGVTFELWLIIQACLGLAVFAMLARFAYRHLGDRVLAAGFVFAVAATYVGGQYVFDDHAYFDTLAVAALVAALVAPRYSLQAGALLVAMWTDERAVLATIAVLAYAALLRDRRRALVVGATAATYAVGRLVLGARYGLNTPAGPDWVDLAVDGLHVSVPGLLLALKGLWVFPAIGFVTLVRQGRSITAALLAGALGLSCAGALAVLDVTRSAAYALPAVLVGLAALASQARALQRRVVGVSLGACLLLPTFFLIVADWAWILPLPLQVAR